MTGPTPLLEARNVTKGYHRPENLLGARTPATRVLSGIDLTVGQQESVGLVGESGSGKSTLARILLGLDRPWSGNVFLDGDDLFALKGRDLKQARGKIQAVFQDPYGSLDPRFTVRQIILEPVASLKKDMSTVERNRRVLEVLDAVGLTSKSAERYPHEFSGGQRQRIAIARAIVTVPRIIIADEPVSALDVSVQAQILNLMMDLQERLGLAYLFISHNLGVVRAVTDRVAVIYAGRILEEGPTSEVFASPRHPYTRTLIEAAPKPVAGARKSRISQAATPFAETPVDPDRACPYARSCPIAEPRCLETPPRLANVAPSRRVACHLA